MEKGIDYKLHESKSNEYVVKQYKSIPQHNVWYICWMNEKYIFFLACNMYQGFC